eukprot:TRINITY_DN794_c0_g1_i1.p1 TRINITY_DN794_c0_g1~~TRINITY_DN794_c0_g1_i1.p1  ORF type:complete len:439 (+),score=90.93 TRINITY_DN794_c0_g1_i1:106-1422(+)
MAGCQGGMSLVCFPFKEEDVTVVVRNVELAAAHPLVAAVLCVGYSRGDTWHAIERSRAEIEEKTGKHVILQVQRRVGLSLREGKGDGMNTALAYFIEHKEFERLHFYDADIVSFSGDWISKAEKQADLDFDIVRHYFPRSSTDAMITWMVTKIGFALLWPDTCLPHVEQPLGGELLLTRRAVDVLAADPRVTQQSDWGIDTLYTFVAVQAGLRMAEVYITEGKVHALYGDLRDLRTMLVECFSAMQSLRHELVDGTLALHRMEISKPVPQNVREKIGYDVEKTLKLLRDHWTPRQHEILQEYFDSALAEGMAKASEFPSWGFCDEAAWVNAYPVFLEHFQKGDSDWEELLFKIWVARVLNHTLKNVLRGYDVALGTLRDLVSSTQHNAAMRLKQTRRVTEEAVEVSLGNGHASVSSIDRVSKKPRWVMQAEVVCTVQQ